MLGPDGYHVTKMTMEEVSKTIIDAINERMN